jgi:hypothetical protein
MLSNRLVAARVNVLTVVFQSRSLYGLSFHRDIRHGSLLTGFCLRADGRKAPAINREILDQASASFVSRVRRDAPGAVAACLWWMLRWVRHAKVAVLDGGFAKWKKQARPVTVDVPLFTPLQLRDTP